MLITIHKGADKKEIETALKPLEKKKPRLIDYYGKLKGVFGNGLEYQKKVRDEWD